MELVPAGVALSFEVTFDADDLDVGMTIYDTSGVSPVQVLAPSAMTLLYGNTYMRKFTPTAGKSYVVVKSVYTDNTFATLDSNYLSGSESIYAQYLTLANTPLVGSASESENGACPFKIFTGDDETIYMRVDKDACAGGGPLDLSSCTEISVALPNADGTFEHLTLADGDVTITSPAILGKFSVDIDSDVSALLNPGMAQNIDVTFTIASKVTTVRFAGALSVFERDA